MPPSTANSEIAAGERFAFGANWSAFLSHLDDDRMCIAEESLRELLQLDNLRGRSLLDLGSGSGLFSLAAVRLGAARVVSVDFDPRSVACAEELKRRYFAGDERWEIRPGSALDRDFLRSLGSFDIVYSWGVLHHTGDMWRALDHASQLVATNGRLALALYNDQGLRSRAWLRVKQLYCSSAAGNALVRCAFLPWFFVRACLVSLFRGRNEFADYRRKRGMSITHDWIDWLGGLPFEVAAPTRVRSYLAERGFELLHERLTRRLGCNEFLFQRRA